MSIPFTIFRKKTWVALCLFFVLLFRPFSSFAQTNPINPLVDSLKAELKKAKTDSVRADLLREIALGYQGIEHEKALVYGNRALKMARRVSPKKEGHALVIIGLLHFVAGESKTAIKCMLRALKIFDKIKSYGGATLAYSNMGLIYNEQKNRAKAIECYLKALKGFKFYKDIEGESACYHNLASTYANSNKPELALEYYRKGMALDIKINQPYRIAASYHSMGEYYAQYFQRDSAQFYYKRSLEIFKTLPLDFSFARLYTGYANLQSELSNADTAILYAQKAYDIVKPVGPVRDLANIYKVLALSYALKGDYKKSALYKDSLILVNDSLYSSALAHQTEELEAKYQSAKKDNALVKLRLEKNIAKARADKQKLLLVIVLCALFAIVIAVIFYIRQRKIRESQRRSELEQKALRAQMNPHFIFNSLNSIQRMYVEGENDKANEYMGDFAELMRGILDNSNKTVISLKEELHSLRLYLELEKVRCRGMMEYEIIVDSDINQNEIQLPPLVIQPFVENAIWHGILPKKSAGKVKIHLTYENEKKTSIICNVEDDGVGWTMGNGMSVGNGKKHESKGISITEQRLGTLVKAEKRAGGGTKVSILIPLQK